jgi:hypothetical protein
MVELINLKLYFYIYDEEKKKAFYTLPLALKKKNILSKNFQMHLNIKKKVNLKTLQNHNKKITNLLIKLEKEHGDFRYR